MYFKTKASSSHKKSMLICAAFFALMTSAVTAEAVPLPLYPLASDLDPFGDGTVLVDVFAQPGVGSQWTFTYDVENPGRQIWYLSVGYVNPINPSETYVPLVPASSPPLTTSDTGNSVMIMWPYPGLPINDNYTFDITYDIFVNAQSLGFMSVSGTSMESGSSIAEYERPNSDPVPEPATAFLLITGIAGLGLLFKKRRRAG